MYEDLEAQLANSPNLSGHAIARSGNRIYLPGGTENFIPLDTEGGEFRGEINCLGSGKLKVRVVGRLSGAAIARAIEIEFEAVSRSVSIFDFGIVTRGTISLSGGGLIGGGVNSLDGSVLSLSGSAHPVSMSGDASVAGDVFMSNPKGTVAISGNNVSIGGTRDPPCGRPTSTAAWARRSCRR